MDGHHQRRLVVRSSSTPCWSPLDGVEILTQRAATLVGSEIFPNHFGGQKRASYRGAGCCHSPGPPAAGRARARPRTRSRTLAGGPCVWRELESSRPIERLTPLRLTG